MKMSRSMLELLWMNQIPHSYVYVGKTSVLVEHIPNEDIPPLEVIVKAFYVGTDKHRYYDFTNKVKNAIKKITVGNEELLAYPKPYVRFDFRNPNLIRTRTNLSVITQWLMNLLNMHAILVR